jgi:hypothetical protein
MLVPKGTVMFWRKKKNEPLPEPPIEIDPPRWRQPVVTEPKTSALDKDSQVDVVQFTDDGQIRVSANSVAEAKLAIKELRLRKKAVGLEKRQVTQAITALNAERRRQTANQGSMMRGGGNLGKFTRGMQSMGRDAERRNHAARLQPYEQEKARLDRYTLGIDQMINQLEAYILQNTD